MAGAKSDEVRAADVIKNWLRNRYTIEFLGTWEQIHNPNFNVVEFDHFRMHAGLPNFVLSVFDAQKFAYIKIFLYLCTRFLKGVMKTPVLERFLPLDYSDVGWSIHSAPIEHPLSIHWDQVENRWIIGGEQVVALS